MLWPEMFDREALKRLKRQLGPYAAASQLQQLPSPQGGAIFPRAGWRWYDPQELPLLDEVIISVDLALTAGPHSDYCVAQVWGSSGADKYLLDHRRAKLAFIEQITMIEQIINDT